MNEIQIKGYTISSLEVAEMVEKKHNELLKDIRRYIAQLDEGKIPHITFFIDSEYTDRNNRQKPCFDVTKKGCEFIANKMTGKKGTIFTARYINRFHDMEDMLSGNKMIDVEKFPEFSTNQVFRISKTPVPKNPNWYSRNLRRMKCICEKANQPLTMLFHHVLLRLGEVYDLNAAKKIYMEETGECPKYALDIVSYFPELAQMADAYLDRIEKL